MPLPRKLATRRSELGLSSKNRRENMFSLEIRAGHMASVTKPPRSLCWNATWPRSIPKKMLLVGPHKRSRFRASDGKMGRTTALFAALQKKTTLRYHMRRLNGNVPLTPALLRLDPCSIAFSNDSGSGSLRRENEVNFLQEQSGRQRLQGCRCYALGLVLVQNARRFFPFWKFRWVVRWVIVLVAAGLPIALVLLGLSSLTPEESSAPKMSIW